MLGLLFWKMFSTELLKKSEMVDTMAVVVLLGEKLECEQLATLAACRAQGQAVKSNCWAKMGRWGMKAG